MSKRNKFLSVVLAIVIVLGILVVPAKTTMAAGNDYTAVVNGKSYGTYSLFTSSSDVTSFIKNNMMAKNSDFSFYFVDKNREGSTDFFRSLLNNAQAHDGTPNGGDYLAKSYSNYQFKYSKFGNFYQYNGVYVNLYLVTFSFSFFDSASDEAVICSNLDAMIASLNLGSLSEYEKVLAIYNWITTNVSYDYSNSGSVINDYHSFTPYNALIKKTAVCQGVCTLFYRALLKVGIDNRIVNNSTHCWNIVRVDGKYYYCDPTWDLGMPSNSYIYFLSGRQSRFEKDHAISDLSINLGYTINQTSYVSSTPVNTSTSNSGSSSNSGSTSSSASNELIKGFVNRLYIEAMGRAADSSGLDYWTGELASKKIDGAKAARSFINSSEFKNKNLDDEAYLAVLYRVFFNRTMDEGGKNYWLGQLRNGSSREAVLEGFIGSKEWSQVCDSYGIASGSAVAVSTTPSQPASTPAPAPVDVTPNDNIYAFASRLYECALNRTPDQGGLDYWAKELANRRVTGTAAAYKFLFSDELINANISDEEYINRLYRTFMGREADASGFSYWMSCIANGSSRKDVFDGFSTSAEFTRICSEYGIDR